MKTNNELIIDAEIIEDTKSFWDEIVDFISSLSGAVVATVVGIFGFAAYDAATATVSTGIFSGMYEGMLGVYSNSQWALFGIEATMLFLIAYMLFSLYYRYIA